MPKFLISNFSPQYHKQSIIEKVSHGVYSSDDCTHVEDERGECALPIVDANSRATDVIVEVQDGHVIDLEAVVVVSVLVCLHIAD